MLGSERCWGTPNKIRFCKEPVLRSRYWLVHGPNEFFISIYTSLQSYLPPSLSVPVFVLCNVKSPVPPLTEPWRILNTVRLRGIQYTYTHIRHLYSAATDIKMFFYLKTKLRTPSDVLQIIIFINFSNFHIHLSVK